MMSNYAETLLLSNIRQQDILTEAAKQRMINEAKRGRLSWLSRITRNNQHSEADNAAEWVETGRNANLGSI